MKNATRSCRVICTDMLGSSKRSSKFLGQACIYSEQKRFSPTCSLTSYRNLSHSRQNHAVHFAFYEVGVVYLVRVFYTFFFGELWALVVLLLFQKYRSASSGDPKRLLEIRGVSGK